MIKCEAIAQFTLREFNKLQNIKRKSVNINGTLFVGDTFECDKKMAEYLMGKNDKGKTVIKILQVEPIEKKKASKKKEN